MTRRFDAIDHRSRAGRPFARGSAYPSRHDGGAHRAEALWRHLRQYRLHADEDAGRQRLCGASRSSRAASMAWSSTVAIKIDMARVKARADTVAANSRAGVEKWLRGMPGCTVIQGHARFEGPDTIRVGEEQLTAPTHLHQRRRPRRGARDAGRRRNSLSHQQLDPCARPGT